jgi:hypothetical protein
MYMLYVEGKDLPKYIHRDFYECVAEAKRLALKENRKVYVFSAFRYFLAEPIKPVEYKVNYYPVM